MSKATPEQMTQTMIDNMPEKTGKPMKQWLQIVAKSGIAKHGEIVKNLKAEFGMGHGFANLVAHTHLAAKAPAIDAGDLVAEQYKGQKEGLRPIYDALTKMISAMGKDVEVSPKKTYVSYRRSKQFALVQASTKDRVDVGINLKGIPTSGRLEASGSFNAMVSHRVRLSSKSDLNNELKAWIKKAYDAA